MVWSLVGRPRSLALILSVATLIALPSAAADPPGRGALSQCRGSVDVACWEGSTLCPIYFGSCGFIRIIEETLHKVGDVLEDLPDLPDPDDLPDPPALPGLRGT